MQKPSSHSKLIDGRAKDGFDKQSWIEEADRHLRSARILRDSRKRRRAAHRKNPRRGIDNILAMDAAVHSSILLVSYAIELFLKAGLTRVYIGCSKELFGRDVKRYGHDLVKLAREIEYPVSSITKKHLHELRSIILSEGRYPFLSETCESQRNRINQRAHRFWSDERFKVFCSLADDIRTHAQLLDGDSNDPASYSNAAIDHDGYFAFRCGGRLPPRITVKYSGLQLRNGTNNKRALKRLVSSHFANSLIGHFWDSACYRCVKL